LRARAAALAVAVAFTACGGDGGDGRSAGGPTPTPAPFEAVEELAASMRCEDVQDVGTGGNAGLSAFGVCHIGRHNVDIYVTSDRAQWEHLAEQFPSVLGPGWIVVCPTGAKAARIVHDRLGGELRIPGRA
jgi:hypothetical protein